MTCRFPRTAAGPIDRRGFLTRVAQAGMATGVAWGTAPTSRASQQRPGLMAGEGVVDTTPPMGIELAGFHRPPGQERRIEGIRQPTAVRAIVLRYGATKVALVSLDILGVDSAMVQRVQRRVAKRIGVPATNVRLCATHTHSMPAFLFLRQWGAIPKAYMAAVETKAVDAAAMAHADLAPASLFVGKARVDHGNSNRTVQVAKTDAQFTEASTDQERWLDTLLHVLHFERTGGKHNLLWYHFSAHPVCFADAMAGPDWPGLVGQRVRESLRVTPSFLQGHAGDVNAGSDPNKPVWRGDAEFTANAVHTAIEQAVNRAARVSVDTLRSQTGPCGMPLDVERFRGWLAAYRQDASKCNRGTWVDARFAKAWFAANANRAAARTELPVPVTAMRIGSVGLVFHPGELFSYYGLAMRHRSPLPNTLVVGYADGLIGYLPDPHSYEAKEYAAIVVPKILDLPPFRPTAARVLTAEVERRLNQLAR